jgi:hypothetical protein
MPFECLLAECQAQPVPGVFFPVQTFKHLEDLPLELRVYTRAVVLYREHPIEIHSFGRNVNPRRRFVAVFDGVPN